jgi:hypothetical protein
MATHSSSDGEHVVTSTEHDEKTLSPEVQQVEAAFDIDANDLPKGYFLRPFFLGTLLASGLSVSAVRKLSLYLTQHS